MNNEIFYSLHFLLDTQLGEYRLRSPRCTQITKKYFNFFELVEEVKSILLFMQKGIKNCVFTKTYGNLHRSENMAVYCILKVAVHSSGYLSKKIKSLILKNKQEKGIAHKQNKLIFFQIIHMVTAKI